MSIAHEIERLNRIMAEPNVKPMKMSDYEFLVNSSIGYYPYFSVECRKRVKKKKATNIVVVGEGGIGKTYFSSDISRVIDRRFTVDEVVFTFHEFMRCVNYLKMGIPICFDEPSYAMSKKDWYDDLNKALVKTIESFRFKVHPLTIPVINKSLLEKTVRNYLVQFQVVMNDRGKGTVYRLYPDHFKDHVYRYTFCKIQYDLFDNNICNKPSCLSCRKLNPPNKENQCMLFRAMYERKKASTQEERYERAIDEAEQKESKNLTDDEIEEKAVTLFDKFYNKDKDSIDVEMMKVALRREFKIRLGHNQAYKIKALIEYDHPNLFTEPKGQDISTN